MKLLDRRNFIMQTSICAGALSLTNLHAGTPAARDVLAGVQTFLHKVANPDGSFRPGIDPGYPGNSDTAASGIASPAYASILSATFGWDLPYPEKTRKFILSCQKPDGAFYAPTGNMDPETPLAKLYNTLQSLIILRLLGGKPKYDPMPVIDFFFSGEEFKNLPLYTTSFFPLFFFACGKKMPSFIDQRMREYILELQQEDGYLRNHVASTYHAAHYFRCIGQPTPRAAEMVERVLRDQKEDGSWTLKEPDWDVHACFDALFILRQLGSPEDPRIKRACEKATGWILACRKPDGGFAHYPEVATSDVDALYFHAGGLVESGYLQVSKNLRNEEILGWGHAMNPRKEYNCL
jgi:prenyltransferase beta subunit